MRLRRVVPDGSAQVFVKLEYFNPTGSYKDRMAKSIIEEAERRGDLKPGMTVADASGGSTGSSLAFVCPVKGYHFIVASSNAFAMEKLRTMRSFGATVDLIHSPSGEISADLIPSMIRQAQEVSNRSDCYYSDQFNNLEALIGYEEIGHELVKQFPDGIDAFCGKDSEVELATVRIVVLEPASSPVISKGWAGTHHVEGIGVGFVPPLLNQDLYDEARSIPEEEVRAMCHRLAREEGLLVGTSTGLNVTAVIRLAKESGQGKTVVTVASDTGLKYMNGRLFADA
ncbi:cysteine synthase family protein [Rhizobium leguminosarum]|uniref:PLP-dependent cysteine synthase family protein n=1 Tax=Rhizobium leguminosarum TaxID=384 RepID=UPI0028F3FA83|nr:cysteine synthase family protein [Rhizobium leguminosarum]